MRKLAFLFILLSVALFAQEAQSPALSDSDALRLEKLKNTTLTIQLQCTDSQRQLEQMWATIEQDFRKKVNPPEGSTFNRQTGLFDSKEEKKEKN